ncbi:PhnD/SsuA/transferrin family substrate-binding protein [Arcobacter sp. FWKO B]|uniref:PhnD/SsuA/transferrin family substrate-binding protein n=1 Tax=Arcobacter sp. FWKO B TaxID=2593672 RepID=UPI00190389C4|nr:PhnD/SsuA/transferrin family substrate-binding protein [Arcobacter sp. FWKO B]
MFKQSIRIILVLIVSFIFTNSLYAKEKVRFGVFAYLGYEKTKEKYEPLVEYLNNFLTEEEVILEVLTQEEMDKRIDEKSLDIATTNPTHFLFIRTKYDLGGVVATLMESSSGHYLDRLGGVIITRADNILINELKDIKGKAVVAPSQKHMGGFRAQIYELYKAGIDVSDLKSVTEVQTHQNVVKYILDNKSEVGFIREGVLEQMAKDNLINLDDIKVINLKQYDNFPYMVSTKLYPEWPVFALNHVDKRIVRRFASALFSIEPDTIRSGIYGYSTGADYLDVEELSRQLRLPPFDVAPEFSLLDIWNKWNFLIIIAVIAFMVISILAAKLAIMLRDEKIEKSFRNSLLSGIGEGVVSINKDLQAEYVNNIAIELLGYDKNELLIENNKNILRLKNSMEAGKCPVLDTFNDHKTRSVNDFLVKKDGSLLPVNLTIAYMDSGGVVIIFRDISQAIEYEQTLKAQALELKELNENLEQKIIIEVEKNRKQNLIIEQQLRLSALGEIITNISHHWRQPLSAITTYLGTLQIKSELGTLEPADIEEAQQIIEVTTSLSKTIDDFRSLVSGNHEAEHFCIQNSFYKAYDILEPSLKENNIHIEVSGEGSKIFSKGFPNELTQVFLKILNNAQDILVLKDIHPRIVKVAFIEINEKIRITIHDNGGGISDDIIKNIFDPYFTTKHKSRGVGLGLYIAVKIMQDYFGGIILAKNEEMIIEHKEYLGAKFTIEFDKRA